MSKFMFEEPSNEERAARSGVTGYRQGTDDRLYDDEFREAKVKPGSRDQGEGPAARAPGMMPPPMGGAPGGAAGVGNAGVAGPGGLGATAARAGASGALGAPGIGGANLPASPGIGGASIPGASGVGASSGGLASMPGGLNPAGLSALGSVGGLRPAGTIAAGADGAGYSPYGINPATGKPWQPSDPGFPGSNGGVLPTTSSRFNPDSHSSYGINPATGRPWHPSDPGYPPADTARFDDAGINPTTGQPWRPEESGYAMPGGRNGVDMTGLDRGNGVPVTPAGGLGEATPSGVSGLSDASAGFGGNDAGSFAVNPGSLYDKGKEWAHLSAQMDEVNKQIAALALDPAKFGIITEPAANYGQAQQYAGVSVVRSARDFSENRVKLNYSQEQFISADETNSNIASNSLGGK